MSDAPWDIIKFIVNILCAGEALIYALTVSPRREMAISRYFRDDISLVNLRGYRQAHGSKLIIVLCAIARQTPGRFYVDFSDYGAKQGGLLITLISVTSAFIYQI